MAIGTGDAVEKFGTADDVTGGTSGAVVNNAFSAIGDVSDWTNDDDAVYGSAIFEGQFGTAPTAGSTIDLYARLDAMAGPAADSPDPDANFPWVYLGTFQVDASTVRQHLPIEIPLPNTKTSQVYNFVIRNNGTGQTISANWQLWIIPKAIGAAA
jgi:hypothetical protein